MDERDEERERMHSHYAARRAALHRSRMRWWKHAREYVVLRSLIRAGLIKRQPDRPPVADKLPDHPPWSHDHPPWSLPSNWRTDHTAPVRWVRQG